MPWAGPEPWEAAECMPMSERDVTWCACVCVRACARACVCREGAMREAGTKKAERTESE